MSTSPAYHPHHDGSVHYSPGGAAPEVGDRVPVRVRVPHRPDGSLGARRMALRSVRDGEPHVVAADQVAVDEHGAWWEASLHVVNRLTSYRFLVSEGPTDYRWLNAAGVHARDVTDASDFKVSTEHRAPDWVADQIGYQVFPDRFERDDHPVPTPEWAHPAAWDDPVVHRGPDVPFQWYGGTLDGIARRLGHLTDLGTTMLYLTPVFEAWSNHRYDARSFDHVDPVLGGDAALERLLAAAHDAGIRVMGDLTTNHTGDRHAWFERALADPGSPERSFYRIDEHGDYAAWLDIASLPKLDHRSAELRRRLYEGDASVVARWLKAGLDGWRIDVANMTGRLGDDDLAHDVAAALRRTMTQVAPDSWLLAEHGHDASLDLTGPGWHGTMDYSGFTRPAWCWLNGGNPGGPGVPHGLHYLGLPVDIPVLGGPAVAATMREVHASMPWAARAASTMHLDTHDTPRFRTVTGGGVDGWVDRDGSGRDRHLVGLALQMTVPGVPVIFAGDEIGLTGLDGEHARTPYPWKRSDEWDTATLAAYRTWIGLRAGHVALRRGGLRWVQVTDDSLTFLREHPEERLLVHLVRAGRESVPVPLAPLGLGSAAALETVVGDDARPVSGTPGVAALPGQGPSAHVYRLG